MKNKNIFINKRMLFSMLILFTLLITDQPVWGQCACPSTNPNLVVDGGFEVNCAGALNFTSDMNLSCNPAVNWPIGATPNGLFFIGNNPYAPNWDGFPNTGNSYFVGDGLWGDNTTPNSNRAWMQNVNVVAGNRYRFMISYFQEQNNPPIALEIGGNIMVVSNPNIDPMNVWLQLCCVWTAPATGPVQLCVRKYNAFTNSIQANDFGLDDIMFNQIDPFSITPQPDQTICKGGSATLNAVATGGSGNFSYLWSNGATTAQISVAPDVTTDYTVTITDNSASCPATIQDVIEVKVIDLTLDLGSDVMVCITYPTNIQAFPVGGSGNYSYLWNTGATTSSINVSNANPGLYSVTVTDNVYGCTVTDNIRASQWQCVGIKYYQNTSSLPSFTHYGMIKAGKNVDPAHPPQGDVVVLNGQNITFHASNYISLEPGFKTNPGGVFVGDILQRCSFGTASIVMSRTDYCTYRLTATAENGSNNYSYLWNTGATTKDIVVSPTVNTSYSVTITDNCLGNNATVSYNLVLHYKGAFTYTLFPNLVTPNGDGYNDIWKLPDNGKTEYAFNAYQFTFAVYNSWGGRVYLLTGTAPLNSTGFKEGDIYWNPSSVSDGVYYAYLNLKNCDNNSQVVSNGWIQVIRGTQRVGAMNGDTTSLSPLSKMNLKDQLEVAPNPSTGIFNYYTSSADNELLELKVFNIFGALVYSRTKESFNGIKEGKLDLSSYPDGFYLIHYKTKKGDGIKKVILDKN